MLAVRGDHHNPHFGVVAGPGELFDQRVALIGAQRVRGIGPVERDREDSVRELTQDGRAEGGDLGFGHHARGVNSARRCLIPWMKLVRRYCGSLTAWMSGSVAKIS